MSQMGLPVCYHSLAGPEEGEMRRRGGGTMKARERGTGFEEFELLASHMCRSQEPRKADGLKKLEKGEFNYLQVGGQRQDGGGVGNLVATTGPLN